MKCLVEWKSYADATEYDSVVEAGRQVESLVKLLQFDKPDTMTVLHSLGYFQYEDQDRHLFGFISAFPPKADCNQPPVSLNDLLVDGGKPKRSHSLPTLPQRIWIAQRLAITLLELHNADWLHKDLNSKNVIFFQGSGAILNLDTPYVSGFEYARPDNISAISFSVRSSPTDIYRHPSLLGPFPAGQKRPRYNKIHDIYSLGLLLLEIGLWKQVGDFRKANTKPADFSSTLKQLASRELPHRVGDVYRDVVLRCIEGKDLFDADPLVFPDSSEKGGRNPSLVKFYWSVIRELERCHCK
jgi:serine/threonine protein kinase